MELEGKGLPQEAKAMFLQAWKQASNNFEKFTAAHYVARHQNCIKQKLEWDERALAFALDMNDDSMEYILPSLYLNIGNDYEQLNDLINAKKYFEVAYLHIPALPNDGYGNMIKNGIMSGIARVPHQRL